MKTRDEARGQGHWLASVMLNGPGRKEPESRHGPLFSSKKRNTRQVRRSKLSEIERNGKES